MSKDGIYKQFIGVFYQAESESFWEEKNRSWCSSSNSNDQRAVTIECASDAKEPYRMNERVYDSLIRLCVDICKRNGKKKLLWFGDKEKALNYVPAADEMVLTVHRWFANVSIPDLNIREGAGTDTAKTGEYTGVGTFTIVEVRAGEGSENGWGRLKSGMG